MLHLYIHPPQLRCDRDVCQLSLCPEAQAGDSPLPNPVPVHNVDGTPNENGSITEEVEVILQYGQHTEKARLAVANLGWQTLIIRHSWLTHHNLEVDWACQSVTMS